MFLKPSTLAINRGHGDKNISPLRNLSASATYYLSSLISFPNFDDITMDYIMVNSDDAILMYGTGNSISGNDIASENEEYPVNHPEEERDTEYEGMHVTRKSSLRDTEAVK